MKRRLEVRAEVGGDHHHRRLRASSHGHPRDAACAARSRYPGRRLWAVLEPRSNTLRRNVFEGELVESLALADQVVLAAVFKSENIPVAERLHPEHVVAALNTRRHACQLLADADAIVAAIVAAASQREMSSRSSPMADSAASTRSYLPPSQAATPAV